MSEQTRISHPKELLSCADVEGFDSLAELAPDMRSSWNHATDQVWRQLDPVLWEITQNPWVVLQIVSRKKLQRVLADRAFRRNVDYLVRARRDAVVAPAWFQQTYPQSQPGCVAYFNMEFTLSEALPTYSGGLGNVAGDQSLCKPCLTRDCPTPVPPLPSHFAPADLVPLHTGTFDRYVCAGWRSIH